MISDELFNKFDRIEDLPVSEEMLGAYMEGNLHGSEYREVQNFINDTDYGSNMIDIVERDIEFIKDLDDISYQPSCEDLIDVDNLICGISLPEIPVVLMDSFIDTSSPLIDDFIVGDDCNHFHLNENNTLYTDNIDNHVNGLDHHSPELDCGLTDNI